MSAFEYITSGLSIVAIAISIIAIRKSSKANRISIDANEISKESNRIAKEAFDGTAIERKIAAMPLIYIKSINGAGPNFNDPVLGCLEW